MSERASEVPRSALREPPTSEQTALLAFLWDEIVRWGPAKPGEWPTWDYVQKTFRRQYPGLPTPDSILDSMPRLTPTYPGSTGYGFIWISDPSEHPLPSSVVGLSIAGLMSLGETHANAIRLADGLTVALATLANWEKNLDADPRGVARQDVRLADHVGWLQQFRLDRRFALSVEASARSLQKEYGHPVSLFENDGEWQAILSGNRLMDYENLTSGNAYLDFIDKLESAREQPQSPMTGVVAMTGDTSVFIVHGHDEARKHELARVLHDLTNDKPMILHEQANKGRTVIEKFEQVAANSGYAVVLLTADDFGRAKDANEDNPRGRQNVVFEMGFFMGSLSRGRVAVLYEEGVEPPSDMQGIVYIALDKAGAWKMSLATELEESGYEVNWKALRGN